MNHSRAQHNSFHLFITFLAWFVLHPTPCPAYGQLIVADTPLSVSPEGELAKFWEVRRAGLEETVTETMGYLDIRNNSETPLDNAIFYGEYFDRAGRLCFSLVFSQRGNIGQKGPILRGETRRLTSSAVGLFTASQPNRVNLHLVQQGIAGQPSSLSRWNAVIHAPVTLDSGIGSDATNLQLGSEATRDQSPVLNIVFANVSVSATGTVERIDVLNTLSSGVEVWFRNLVRQQLKFYPATENGTPKSDQALVLVRAISIDLSKGDLQSTAFPPGALVPWVRGYAGQLKGVIPQLTEIVFRRPPTEVKHTGVSGVTQTLERPVAPQGLFELFLLGTDWSSTASKWIPDPTMPMHRRRELIGEIP